MGIQVEKGYNCHSRLEDLWTYMASHKALAKAASRRHRSSVSTSGMNLIIFSSALVIIQFTSGGDYYFIWNIRSLDKAFWLFTRSPYLRVQPLTRSVLRTSNQPSTSKLLLCRLPNLRIRYMFLKLL